MAKAVQLARRGQYSTAPNPCVGCVIVQNGAVIGSGWHQQAGQGHAEVNALADAAANGHDVRGACVYVTLEPCSHVGKTPPCADALITAGVARVVYAMQDPNPQVAGRGLDKCRAAGITVIGPLLESEAQALNAGFIQRMTTGLPRVTAKMAASLDGRTAMASGESQWITGPAARADVQALRARSCAIITGSGTVLADNPQLNVRDAAFAGVDGRLRQPLRVIVDSRLRTPLDAKILSPQAQVLLVYAQAEAVQLQALAQQGIETLALPDATGAAVDLSALLVELGRRQCNEVLVEAGATLLGAFLQQQLLDVLVLYTAPTLLGSDARSMALLPLTQMHEQIRFHVGDIRLVGDDIRWRLQPQRGEF